jgi:DNA-binding transcriptional regulator YiaG
MNPDRIKAIRATTGLSQPKFARVCNVKPDTIAKLEIGRAKPGPSLTMVLEMIERGELPNRYMEINT